MLTPGCPVHLPTGPEPGEVERDEIEPENVRRVPAGFEPIEAPEPARVDAGS